MSYPKRKHQVAWFRPAAILLVIMLVNWPLLDDFVRLLESPRLAVSSPDAATHFLRTMNARNLYLPSGHHLGWDPYWYQGYVPFLLYPHLTYVALATASLALPIEPVRIFNAYTVAIYFALPLAGGVMLLSSLGLRAAAIASVWISLLSTVGAGLQGVFFIGLLTQQVGVMLFLVLACDLIVTRRIDRASVWLGLLPLVHIHSAVAGVVLWIGTAVAIAVDRNAKGEAREWVWASVVALLIAAPSVLGLAHGWGNLGGISSFGTRQASLISQLVAGRLGATWPILLAMFLTLFVGAVCARRERRFFVWLGICCFLVVLSVNKWNVGEPFVDRVFHTMLYLRTLPFAFVLAAVLAASKWHLLPRWVKGAAVGLTMIGAILSWSIQMRGAEHIGRQWTKHSTSMANSIPDYQRALDWISEDIGSETATLAISVPRPQALPLAMAVERCGLPMLSGHGVELTSIRNSGLTGKMKGMTCGDIRRQVQYYGVGYIAGTELEARGRLAACLRREPAVEYGSWWVFATGHRWLLSPKLASGFSHDPTWTKLSWHLRARTRELTVRLPMTNSAPWTAEVDGERVEIATTEDGMMSLSIPPEGGLLSLRYQGFWGEWASVGVTMFGLLLATILCRTDWATKPPAEMTSTMDPANKGH